MAGCMVEKIKETDDVSVLEVEKESPQFMGDRALTAPESVALTDGDFLQLRSRTLRKTTPAEAKLRQKRRGGSSKGKRGKSRKSEKVARDGAVVANEEVGMLGENEEGVEKKAKKVEGDVDFLCGDSSASAIEGVVDEVDDALAKIDIVGDVPAAANSGGGAVDAANAGGAVADPANAGGGAPTAAAIAADRAVIPIVAVGKLTIEGVDYTIGAPQFTAAVNNPIAAVNAAIGGAEIVAPKGGAAAVAAKDGGDKEEVDEEGEDFFESVLALEANDREIRETTPEHLIIRQEEIPIPETPRGRQPVAFAGAWPVTDELISRNSPSSQEIDGLFSALVNNQNRQNLTAMTRYNFDFKNEKPLPGRYEWVKIKP